ncbi:MAG: leucine-rich repeat domain-containing protein [Oscillospiraceae bacterium]|nr:leucine-rich repeat domain-containing protein [Oscillospiraceae bacterium]
MVTTGTAVEIIPRPTPLMITVAGPVWELSASFCALTKLTLPGCALGKEAFYNCKSLKTVKINEGTESIPAECFRYCTALESITLPDSVQSINCGGYGDEGAFNNCPALKTVSIGSGITYIDKNAFQTKGTELEITFREGVTAIPDESFYGRSELTKVILPDSLKTVGKKAFLNCSNLSVCNFPDGLAKIQAYAFSGTGLTELTLPGCALERAAFKSCGSLVSVAFNEGTESIPAECFRNCAALENVTLPDSVQSIECGGYNDESAFYNCTALESVSIGSGITYIHKYAFWTKSPNLEVIFREGVTAIPEHAFDGGTVVAIILPKTVKTIGQNDISGYANLKLISIQAPDCVIADAAKTIPSAAKIRSSENSTAHAYAEKYNRNFVTFENDEVIAYGNRVLGIGMSLDGKIGLNFRVKLSKDAAKVSLWGGGITETYTGDQLAAAKQSDGTYLFSFGVSATQASEVISMKIYTADGKTLDIYNSEYEKLRNNTVRYSVSDYIANVTAYQNDAKLKALVNALDQYCKSAETYFGIAQHDDLNVANGNFSAYKFRKTGSGSAKIALIMNTETSIRIAYSGKGTVSYGGKVLEKEGNYYYIRNIPAHLLGKPETLVIGDTRYENLSALSYGYAVMNGGSSNPKLKTLVNALYAYAKAAEAYAAAK